MNQVQLNEFYPQLVQKGYTLREVNQSQPVQKVPQWYLNRYPEASYDEYINELHEYLNGL